MPNIKKAAKRMRQAEKARHRNAQVKSRIKKVRGKVLKGAETPEAAESLYRAYCSELDKAAQKGVIAKNTAIRRKKRAAARLKRQSTTPPRAVASSTSS
jgi:small subunit ribosomal protein S20